MKVNLCSPIKAKIRFSKQVANIFERTLDTLNLLVRIPFHLENQIDIVFHFYEDL